MCDEPVRSTIGKERTLKPRHGVPHTDHGRVSESKMID